MRGQACSQNQGHLKLPVGFLVVYVDFESGRRKTFVCCPTVSLLDVMRLGVLYSCVAALETAACPAFLPPIASPLPDWVVLHDTLNLGLHLNCSGTTGLTAVDLGNLVAFFRLSFRLCLVVASLNRFSKVSVSVLQE